MVFIGLLFEDRLYVHTEDVFSRSVWLDQRDNMDLDFPNLPYFIDGDIRLTEHLAIHKYVADKWMPSLLGTNLYERAHVDMLCGVIWDLKKSATMGCYMGDDKAYLTRVTLAKMEELVGYFKKNSGKYLLGYNLCYLDFYLFELLQLIDFTTDGKVYEVYPFFHEYQHRISQLPRLKEYLASDDCLK